MNLYENYLRLITEKVTANDIPRIKMFLLSPDPQARAVGETFVTQTLKSNLSDFMNTHMADYMKILGFKMQPDLTLDDVMEEVNDKTEIKFEGLYNNPPDLTIFKRLETLTFQGCDFEGLSPNLQQLPLKEINCINSSFDIPNELLNVPTKWVITYSSLESHGLASESFEQMMHTETLILKKMGMSQVPDGIYDMGNLQTLSLQNNPEIYEISIDGLGRMSRLSKLVLNGTAIGGNDNIAGELAEFSQREGINTTM